MQLGIPPTGARETRHGTTRALDGRPGFIYGRGNWYPGPWLDGVVVSFGSRQQLTIPLCHRPNAIPSNIMEGVSMLKEGDRAPEFSAMDHAGNVVKLSDLIGQKVWLWFFSSPGGNN